MGILLLYVIPLVISALLSLVLAYIVARNFSVPGARAMAGLLLGVSLWSAGYALEFIVPDLIDKLFWAKFQYFAIVTIPLAWFIFTIQHMGSPARLAGSLRYLSLLWVMPVLTLLLVWTNDFHGLIWKDAQLMKMDSVQILDIHHGPGFWIYWVYAYVLMFLGTIRLVSGLQASVSLHRWQIRLAITASLFPWIGNLVYVSGLSPIEYLDLTPFAFSIAGLLFILSMFPFQLVNILPIAQRRVFDGLADCVLVLDLNDHIVDLNPSARSMIPITGRLLGKPLSQVIPALAQQIEAAGFTQEFKAEVIFGEEPDFHTYELTVSPLRGAYSQPAGRLIVCHDISAHKQAQARLEQARNELESIVSERTEKLRQAVEQLQNELTERTLLEARFQGVVESAPDAVLLIAQNGEIYLVNKQAERLLGYTSEELVGQHAINLISEEWRSLRQEQIDHYTSHPGDWQLRSDRNVIIVRKDDSQFPAEVSLASLELAEGRWVILHIRDITERRQAEQEEKRLLEESRRAREQLRLLTFRLQEVQEFERRQIATELHDRVGQNLTGLNLNLHIIQDQLNKEENPALLSRLEDALQLVEETTRQVRDVMADLRPPMLDEYGLFSALQWYSGRFSRLTGIAARVVGEKFEPRLPPNVELVLFRIVQEALNNVVRHAYANEVQIVIKPSADSATLNVIDNGRGFDPNSTDASSTKPHWGLINIAERVASIGGQFEIDSAPGKGTRLSITARRFQDEH